MPFVVVCNIKYLIMKNIFIHSMLSDSHLEYDIILYNLFFIRSKDGSKIKIIFCFRVLPQGDKNVKNNFTQRYYKPIQLLMAWIIAPSLWTRV